MNGDTSKFSLLKFKTLIRNDQGPSEAGNEVLHTQEELDATLATSQGNPTTLAVGEEGGEPTTLAVGEEGGEPTTQAVGEEGGNATTRVPGHGRRSVGGGPFG